tara:strand:+ start:37987 stop:38436 length:450 start_codon:yes stop_codon:yes gene_type:complete
MKKILLTIGILLLANNMFAQLNVVEKEKKEEIGMIKNLFDPVMETYKRGDNYVIMYKDLQYTQISEWKSFSMNKESFDQLYDLIIQNWNNPPEENIMLDMGEDGFVRLDYAKALGITNVRFMHDPYKSGDVLGFSMWLTEKKLKKLFDK